MTLTDFLRARIAEEKAAVDELIADYAKSLADEIKRYGGDTSSITPLETSYVAGCDSGLAPDSYWGTFGISPARVLAECEAKRGAIEAAWADHCAIEGEWGSGQSKRQMSAKNDNPDVVAYLALPYADHPDYRQEWRP